MNEIDDPPRLTYLVARLERGVRVFVDDAARRHNLTTPQYTTLSVLARRSGLSSAQLARRAFVTPQAMNQIVNELEEQGLIRRTPSPEHRRILRSSLTQKGNRALAACDGDVDVLEASLVRGLGNAQLSTLRMLLAKCTDALGAMSLEG